MTLFKNKKTAYREAQLQGEVRRANRTLSKITDTLLRMVREASEQGRSAEMLTHPDEIVRYAARCTKRFDEAEAKSRFEKKYFENREYVIDVEWEDSPEKDK